MPFGTGSSFSLLPVRLAVPLSWGIAAAAAAGQKGVRGKSPFAVLLKDLHAEIVELKAKGVADIIVGGDFNARHDGSVRPWRQLQAWRKRCGLGDALRELHPATA